MILSISGAIYKKQCETIEVMKYQHKELHQHIELFQDVLSIVKDV